MKFCRRPFDGMYFMPDGNVSVCGWTDATIGNIIEEDIDSIWHGEIAERVRASVKDGSYRYCRKESCPFLENDSLPDISQEEMDKMIATDKPKDLTVANDLICNHSCPSCRDKVFCPSPEYKEKLQKQFEVILPLLNQADTMDACGAGDLFASNMMMDMLSQVRPQNPNCTINLETNGALFDEMHWEKIKHLGEYNLGVTVTPNSFEEDTFRYLNGGHNSYQAVINNLYFLKKLRKEGIIKTLRISIVVQDRNFYELPAFAQRCIEDFGADKVAVKPIYKWFGLSEELHWMKDVMNPEHPYHQEWLKVLEAPILKDPRVYLWGGVTNTHVPKKHPAYKYKDMLDMVKTLMKIDNVADRIAAYLSDKGADEIIIYGDTALAYVIGSMLKDSDIRVKCILARDRSDCEQTDEALRVESFWEYELTDNDFILISNYLDRKYIERDLALKNYKGNLMDIREIVEVLEEQR